MKKIALISIAAMICFLFARVNAYSAEDKNGIFIFEYKKELGLSDKQEKNLRGIVREFQEYIADKQKKLGSLRAELSKMTAESAALDKIKTKINDIAKVQAQITYKGIASSRAIEAGLTGIQLTKWHSIQTEFARNLQQARDAASKDKEIKK